MKKLLLLLALMLVLVLAACGQTEEDADKTSGGDTNAGETNNAEGEDASKTDEMALKSSLLNNYLEVVRSVSDKQKAINAYLGELANAEAEAATVETLKADAITAAEEAVASIDGFTIENLDEDTTAKFEEVLVELKGAYDEYATALAAEEVDVTAAEAKITASNDKLNILFEEKGLNAPNFSKEIN